MCAVIVNIVLAWGTIPDLRNEADCAKNHITKETGPV